MFLTERRRGEQRLPVVECAGCAGPHCGTRTADRTPDRRTPTTPAGVVHALCRVLAAWLGALAVIAALRPRPTAPGDEQHPAQRYRSSCLDHAATLNGTDSNAHQHAADHDNPVPPDLGKCPHNTANPYSPSTHATSRTHRTTHPRTTADSPIIRAHEEGGAW